MKKIIIVLTAILLIVAGLTGYFVFNRKPARDIASIQAEVDSYQQKYFEIIKRNNALLVLDNNEKAIEDLKELKILFDEVKDKVKEENEFLVEYEKNKQQFMVNSGQNTFEMNEFASDKYKAFDGLLNKVYQAVKAELKEDEFEKLKLSQRAWLKEVNDYELVFKAQGFGTIGTLVQLDYKTNMCCFRTLLLMLFLKDN